MRPETLHLTLAFLGSTPRARVDELIEQAGAWSVRLETLALRRFGRFKGPRIVWAGLSIDDADRVQWLDEFYETLWRRLETLGWQRPASVFQPHVSLLRNAGPGDLSTLQRPPIIWTPARCVLVASRTSAAGSLYQALACLPLKD